MVSTIGCKKKVHHESFTNDCEGLVNFRKGLADLREGLIHVNPGPFTSHVQYTYAVQGMPLLMSGCASLPHPVECHSPTLRAAIEVLVSSEQSVSTYMCTCITTHYYTASPVRVSHCTQYGYYVAIRQ